MKPSIFAKEDMILLRRPVAVALTSVALAIVVYVSVDFLHQSVNGSYQRARSQFEQVQTSIQQIAQEESTIVEYIGRYREMVQDALFEEEDRLAVLENVQAIRQENRLFPVSVEMQEQASSMLVYAPEEIAPGEPVQLRYSMMEVRFPLLHEADFFRMMESLLGSRGFFMPTTCQLRPTVGTQGYTEVAENVAATCDFVWFTFQINPPEPMYVE